MLLVSYARDSEPLAPEKNGLKKTEIEQCVIGIPSSWIAQSPERIMSGGEEGSRLYKRFC
jgi:hypothetical protein